jgi:ABC-type spermidine/putrescine transport system permease subunit II
MFAKLNREPILNAGWTVTRLVVIGIAVLVLTFLLLPILTILPLSLSSDSYFSFPPPGWSSRWYVDLANDFQYRSALWNSVRIGVPSALLATILGTFAAVALVRGRLPGQRLMSVLMIAPLILPQIVLAIGLYPMMARMGIVGSYWAIVIGHSVICLPLVFITVSAALASYSPALELAAMTLGAGWWRTFVHVTLPMTRGGVIAGFLFAFTTSFDEVVLAIFLTGTQTRTIPRLLWEKLTFQMTPTVAAATVVIVTFTLLLMLVAALTMRYSRSTET